MSDNHRDLVFEIIKAQTQLCYFLLGLAASAIAFAIHQTKDLSYEQAAWQIWAAIICWGVSFGFGILAARFRIEASIQNANSMLLKKDIPPLYRSVPEFAKMIKDAESNTLNKAALQRFSMFVQQLGMLAGAIIYVWGHILMMGGTRA